KAAFVHDGNVVVKYALESIAETGTYKMRHGRGREQKLTEADVRHIKILNTRDRRKTISDLHAEMNASRSESERVSRMTISRRLLEQGSKGRIAAKKPLLRPANIQKCLRFARESADLSSVYVILGDTGLQYI
uniref:Transposase Tc1-like domain-containing protein n=1 Tax=Lates calcarifer TaxID=8187 RepID=A0A4W6D1N8_LATCA